MKNNRFQLIVRSAIDGDMDDIIKDTKNYYDKLMPSGNIYLYWRNRYNGDFIEKNVFDLVKLLEFNGLQFLNIVVVPSSPIKDKTTNFNRNVDYLVWFCRDINSYYFNKDKIREKHIWKDVEWGKRAKNYNPKGKDPGNVWIPTLDDGKGKIVQHIVLSMGDIVKRCILSSSKEGDSVLLLGFGKHLDLPPEITGKYNVSYL